MPAPLYVEVALLVPVIPPLTYAVPESLRGAVARGCQVLVPLGRKREVGVVSRVGVSAGDLVGSKVRQVQEVLSEEPLLPPALLDLVLWSAGYYRASVGEALRTALPPGLHRRPAAVVQVSREGRRVLGLQAAVLRSRDDDLGPKEQAALELLASRSGGRASLRSVEKLLGKAGLARMMDRGLINRHVRDRRPARVRMDLLLELQGPLDREALGRARAQLWLAEQVQQAGGKARLGQLGSKPRDARRVARALASKGMLRITEVEVPRDPFANDPVEVDRPPEALTAEQQVCLEQLLAALGQGTFAPFLLFGVTSSGKTEVYLQLIARILEQGKNALVLVPEISLTPQLAARFRARFGSQVAVLHSGLSEAERFSQWRLIRKGQLRIVVGARSAVFAPLKNLGVIVVDEEHDPSFKQETGVRYNARDLCLMRARGAGAVALLGSATPSMESFTGAAEGRLTLLRMPSRATPRPLPRVEVVDLRTYKTGKEGILSAPLAQAVSDTLEQGEQTILFLNRRGFSSFVLCKSCGHIIRCRDCSVSMTFHRAGKERLICHYCGYAEGMPPRCPACATDRLGLMGLGTERVEQVLKERFPRARVARLDRDTAQGHGMRQILASVRQREVDILVGTQMVTKGHDFPDVTLVGVICADLGLHFPDFRAGERTFQLLTQVAGRAGRGERPGRVLIQSYSPQHASLRCAREHDYEAYYQQEVRERRELGYPPAGHLVAVHLNGPNGDDVAAAARTIARAAGDLVRGEDGMQGVDILGPTEAPLQKLKGRTRWMMLLKAAERRPLRRLLGALEAVVQRADLGQVRVAMDVDPQSML